MMAAGKKKPKEMNPDPPPSERSLRDSAEEQLARSPKPFPEMMGKTSEQFIYELQVHQIELETQAEELRRAHLALEESRDKFLDLYDFAPTGYLTLTDNALIAEVNLAGATLIGVERSKLVNTRFRRFIAPEFFEQWDHYFVNLLRQEEKQTCTITLKRSNGSTFPARMEGIRLTSSDGVTTARIAISDITDIWQIEALKNEYSILNGILESTDAPVFSLDRKYRYTSFNSHHAMVMKQLYGAAIKPGHSIFDYQSVKEDQIQAKHNIDRALAGEHITEEAFSGDEGRSRRYFEVTHYPIKGTGKKVIGVAVFAQDITGRKAAEEALRASEEKFRGIFDTINDGIHIHTIEPDGNLGKFIEVNEVACRMLHYTREELLEHGPLDIVSGCHSRPLPEIIGELSSIGHSIFETEHRRKDGTLVPVEINAHVVSLLGKRMAVSVVRDITERKQAEVALKESERFLTNIVEQIPDMIFVKDARELRFVRLNKAGEDLLGYSRAEMLGKNDRDFFPKDEANFFIGNDRQVLLTNQLSDNPEEKIQTRHKGERILHTKKISIVDDKGNPEYLLGISEDITDRKKTDEALRETKDYLENLIRYANVPIVSWNPDLMITEFNRAFEHLSGMTREEVIGKSLTILFAEKTRQESRNHIHRALRGEHMDVVEIPIRHVSGETRIVQWNSSNILDPKGKVIATIAQGQDITERKAADETIRTYGENLEREVIERTSNLSDVNQKLVTEIVIRLDAEKQLTKSVGEKEVLLKEVHHRVKNNLQIIISLLNLQSRYITDETTRSAFRESQSRVRAMALVHEKLYQSKDLAKLDLENYLKFLGDNLFQFLGMKGKGITLTIDVHDISLAIDTAIPLGLMINELISNSLKYAFPEGRRGEISLAIHQQDHTLTILYNDNGIGIPEGFDWRNSESLGLRLIISLVEQLDGTVELDRSAGTAFTIIVKEKE